VKQKDFDEWVQGFRTTPINLDAIVEQAMQGLA
jgi:hypothetical protein